MADILLLGMDIGVFFYGLSTIGTIAGVLQQEPPTIYASFGVIW
jgi:hypothetical protein